MSTPFRRSPIARLGSPLCTRTSTTRRAIVHPYWCSPTLRNPRSNRCRRKAPATASRSSTSGWVCIGKLKSETTERANSSSLVDDFGPLRFAIDCSTFHHETDFAQRFDVLTRITFHSDQIGEQPGADRAAVLEPENFGVGRGRRLQRLH